MDQKRCALIFTQDPEGKSLPALRQALAHTQITPLLPHQMTPEAGRVAVIIIERPAVNAATILSNIRRHEEFSKLPTLVILEQAEGGHAAQFSAYKADVLFKPVNLAVLQRYMEALNGAAPVVKEQPKSDPNAAQRDARISAAVESGRQAYREEKRRTEPADLSSTAAESSSGGKSAAPPQPTKSGLDAQIEKAVADLRHVAKAVGEKARAGSREGGKKTEKERVLEDIIPSYTSGMLLSALPPDGEAKKGGIPCEHCRRWKARREDPSCSRCGAPLVALELSADEVSFEPLGDHSVGLLLDLRNAGQNPLWMTFKVVADEQLARRFKLHAEQAALEGKAARQQLITFDARGLDLTTGYQAALEIVTNERGLSKRSLKLVVERRASPRLVNLGGYVFALGSENVWEFGLANDGGGRLRLKGASIDASKDGIEGVPLEVQGPAEVRGGQTAAVRLRVPELNLPIGAHVRKLVWRFEHHPPLTTDFSFEVKRPPSIAVQPLELDFGVVSTSRSKSLDIELVNNGGEELVIESVRPSERAAAWLECRTNSPLPLRIPPGNSVHVELVARGVEGVVDEQRAEVVVRSNSFMNAAQTVPAGVKFVVPTEYEHYIGIDFGTTASCVAVLDKELRPTLLEIDAFDRDPRLKGDPHLMPSVLFFHDDGRVLAGREAQTYAAAAPHKAVSSIKRSLGLSKSKVIAGKEYDAIGVTAQIIEQLLRCAEDGLFQLGQYKTPRKAVLTVPIKFQKNQRDALLDACRRAGLNTHVSSQSRNVIDEAQAAALYYFSQKEPGEFARDTERVLIFDWGGGTLDCALTEIGSDGRKLVMRTLALGGDQRLGGEDIDWALVRLLALKAKQAFPEFDHNCLDVDGYDHHYRRNNMHSSAYATRAQFKRQAEAAKIRLADGPDADVRVTPLLREGANQITPFVMDGAEPAALETSLTRDDLEDVLSVFLERAADVVTTLCERASVSPEDVKTVLHTGRTSRLPLVRDKIKALLPNAEDHSDLVGQKVCVAMGAAFWGRIKEFPSAKFEFIGAANRLVHDIGYMDFDPLSFREVFVPIFDAQAGFPCDRLIELDRSEDVIKLELYENHGKKRLIRGNPDMSFIKSVLIDVSGVAGESVPVHFALDENGRLDITANGHKQVVELSGGD